MAENNPTDLNHLRDRLDSIDDNILNLLCERSAIIHSVAELKADQERRLFDRDREQRMIRVRRDEAARRGVDPDFIENLFRTVILDSHRIQSELIRRQSKQQPRTIAIIGGNGEMGRFFERFFLSLGHKVLIADLDTDLTAARAAAQADIVIISVPINVTERVIEQVAPHMREDAILMDVTSLKQGPVRTMLRCFQGEVVGVHPMFGPDVKTINRQVIALCPARGHQGADWLRQTFESQGVEIVETTPHEHDRAMAIIQVLRHLATIAFGRTLADLNIDIESTLRFASPIYRLELIMVGRLFGQGAALYADIALQNEQRDEVIEQLERSVIALCQTARRGDRAEFIHEFERIGEFFGPFKEQALEESSYLIDTMVKRM